MFDLPEVDLLHFKARQRQMANVHYSKHHSPAGRLNSIWWGATAV